MRRLIATLACTAAIGAVAPALATPAHAQAPAADPVSALKKQFVTGHGVAFSERTTLGDGDYSTVMVRRTGKFLFGKRGVAASDISTKFNLTASQREDLSEEIRDFFAPEQTIRVGTTAYFKGGFFGSFLPADKTWLRIPGGPQSGAVGTMGQVIGVTEPETLKTLLAHGKKVSGGYTGTTTFGELWKVSKWFRGTLFDQKPKAAQSKTKVTWKLFTNAKGVVTRVVSSHSGSASGLSGSKLTTDTVFTGWGRTVSIKAPAAKDVASITDLDLDTEDTSIPSVTIN
ncbi:hypothetical protein ACFHYQ_21315 [Sphaerimonospora cavernae]|uniref:Lipoprotein n=1 Tax=Sphaerimonospora cavernae TaxID=1740611 RepID=A0ABV6U9I9_9ACTN